MADTVFITGIAGFIGRALARSFDAQGMTVKGLARGPVNIGNCQVIAGDVENGSSFGEIAAVCDTLIHLAAPTLGADIHARPLAAMRINLLGTLNALEAFAAGSGKHFILVSTGKVYGPPQLLPITEEHPLNPDTALGKSKLACERLVSFYCEHSLDKTFTILRLFNAYGPGQKAGMLIPSILTQALNENGTGRIVLGNALPKRDFIYIDDVVSAIGRVCSARNEINDRLQILNVGSGTSASPADIVSLLARITKNELHIVCDQSRVRKGEPDEERACIDKLRRLDWTPRHDLIEGLKLTRQAMKNDCR